MPAEAAFSFNARNQRGEQITLRGDDWSEFKMNVTHMLGEEDGEAFIDRFIATAKAGAKAVNVTEDKAIENIKDAWPNATVGEGAARQPNQERSEGPVPGEQRMIGGVLKKWVPSGVSTKTGKPYKGFWGNV